MYNNNIKSSPNYNGEKYWDNIYWPSIERRIHELQSMIYFAAKNRDIGRIRYLQQFLSDDYEAKLLAVKRVTQQNTGKYTPGIDNYLYLSDQDKVFLANQLIIDGTTSYIRRVLIPKPGTPEMRPLGIPTVYDRAKQCLIKFLLEPEFEAYSDSNSFGFRPGRSAIDAISKVRAHLIFNGPCYVLDADIKKCFDRISHEFLLYKISGLPSVNKQISAWLQAGIFTENEIIFPKEGTPQGGIISPLLANIALDGIQNAISDCVFKKFGSQQMKLTYFCRYADDFVVIHPREDVILACKEEIEMRLSLINLEFKQEKTKIYKTLEFNIVDGKTIIKCNPVDFLGFRIKQRFLSKHIIWKEGGVKSKIRTYVLINPDRIRRHKASITTVLKNIGNVEQLINTLNPRIIGWTNYFKHSDSQQYGDLARKMDLWLNGKIRKWIRRTTKLRGKVSKFWKSETKDWILFYTNKENKEITLTKYSSVKWSIYDYKAINSYFSPYAYTFQAYEEHKKLRLK